MPGKSALEQLQEETQGHLAEIEEYKKMPDPDVEKILQTVSKVLTAAAPAIEPKIKWLAIAFKFLSRVIEEVVKEK